MKDLNEYTAELHRRVEMKVQTQRQHRLRVLAVCVPLFLCVAVGAAVLPRFLGRTGTDEAPPRMTELDGVQTMNNAAAGREDEDAALPDGAEGVGAGPGGIEADGGLMQTDGDAPDDAVEDVPEDFSFSLVWGCYGISSYDSRTGRLVKTTDSTHPEDYVTELILTEEQRQTVWLWLSRLNLAAYPEDYDPYNAPDAVERVASEPNRDLILTVRADGRETTVTCRGICLGGGIVPGYDPKARTFLEITDLLTDLLTGTPEWEALPDYEFFYE